MPSLKLEKFGYIFLATSVQSLLNAFSQRHQRSSQELLPYNLFGENKYARKRFSHITHTCHIFIFAGKKYLLSEATTFLLNTENLQWFRISHVCARVPMQWVIPLSCIFLLFDQTTPLLTCRYLLSTLLALVPSLSRNRFHFSWKTKANLRSCI